MRPDLLSRTAARCAQNPAFVGHALAQAGTREAVAVRLGVGVEVVAALCLCRVPQSPADVERLGERFGVGIETLKEMLG